MKALSVKQPWASLIASGRKTIETRRWKTSYRGPLVIVSARTPDIVPAGQALAVANLINCRPMSVLDEPAAACQKYDGAFAWIFDSVRRIDPFSVVGQPGLFELELPSQLDPALDT